jgi:hypothetical protein
VELRLLEVIPRTASRRIRSPCQHISSKAEGCNWDRRIGNVGATLTLLFSASSLQPITVLKGRRYNSVSHKAKELTMSDSPSPLLDYPLMSPHPYWLLYNFCSNKSLRTYARDLTNTGLVEAWDKYSSKQDTTTTRPSPSSRSVKASVSPTALTRLKSTLFVFTVAFLHHFHQPEWELFNKLLDT